MEKLFLFLFIIFVPCFSSAQFYTTVAEYKKQLLQDKDTTSYHIFEAFEAKKYDDVIQYFKPELMKKYAHEKAYCAVAAAYLYKGENKKAYGVIDHYIKRKKEAVDLYYFYDFMMYAPVAKDSIIQTKLLNANLENYRLQNYPLTSAGEELIFLYYNDQRIRRKLVYETLYAKSEEEKQKAEVKFKEEDRKNRAAVLSLYAHRSTLFSKEEVGSIAGQLILFRHIGDDSVHQNFIIPLFQKSYEKGVIDGGTFVEEYTKQYQYKQDFKTYKRLYDSLCPIYNCNTTITIYSQNDK